MHAIHHDAGYDDYPAPQPYPDHGSCPMGSYRSQKTMRCEPCPRGTFAVRQNGRSSCAACPSGRTTLREGTLDIKQCGEHNDRLGWLLRGRGAGAHGRGKQLRVMPPAQRDKGKNQCSDAQHGGVCTAIGGVHVHLCKEELHAVGQWRPPLVVAGQTVQMPGGEQPVQQPNGRQTQQQISISVAVGQDTSSTPA